MASDTETRKRKFNELGEDQDCVLSEAPRNISVVEFAESRALEIEAMTQEVRKGKTNKLTIQLVPRHMRRRAASHNVKRLPRRLRQAALKEMEKYPPRNTKRPSRKHRRRPGNLLKEYNRRSRKHVWLETHIWHAKRFHMAEKWGYKIAVHPNDKSIRAAYRATSQHCLLQDMSYLCCVEIKGPEEEILSACAHITNPDSGLTMRAKYFISGTREGRTIVYKKDQYPVGAISEVTFLWRPDPIQESAHNESTDNSRTLWIWIHPSSYQELLDELIVVFVIMPSSNIDSVSPETVTKKDADSEQHDSKRESESSRHVVLENPILSNGSVTITSLKDRLCRFRLTGPKSQGVLADTFRVADVGDSAVLEGGMEVADAGVSSLATMTWWQQYFQQLGALDAHRRQRQLWHTMKTFHSPSQLPPHCILGLTVRDPRLQLPRRKCLPQDTISDDADDAAMDTRSLPLEVSLSPLWEESVRKLVLETKLSEQEINRRRESNLVPGLDLDFGKDESRIPVLLIHNPGHPGVNTTAGPHNVNFVGYGSGWDLILPAGWAMAFWIALVYRGARVGGVRELQSTALEKRRLLFPMDFPDTAAGQKVSMEERRDQQAKYDRIPPAKRPNYHKLGTATPFHCDWKELVSEWNKKDCKLGFGSSLNSDENISTASNSMDTEHSVSKNEDNLFVLRSRKQLKSLSALCSPSSARGRIETDTQEVIGLPNCLVPVEILMLFRGTPEQFSMVAIPNQQDLTLFHTNTKYGGPLEARHRVAHQRNLKKKGKKKSKNKSEIVNPDCSVQESAPVAEKLLDCCSRQTAGYLTRGGFSFSAARGVGVGFVTLTALLHLLKGKLRESPTVVLIRSPRSLQYRFAHLHVIT